MSKIPTPKKTQPQFPHQKQTVGTCSCGPVCLQNIYAHFNMKMSLQEILQDLHKTEKEVTYTAELARQLLKHQRKTKLISSNPHQFALDWSRLASSEVAEKLKSWLGTHFTHPWALDTLFILFYLQEGGVLEIAQITTHLIDRWIEQGYLILVAGNQSWLWGKRKIRGTVAYDDILGETEGHYVVIYGQKGNEYLVSDPYPTSLSHKEGLYSIDKDQLLISNLTWNPQILVVK